VALSKSAFLLIYGVASLTTTAVLVPLWRRRNVTGVTYAFAVGVSIAIWCTSAFANMLVGPLWAKQLFVDVSFLGIGTVMPVILLFVLTYFGHEAWVTRPVKLAAGALVALWVGLAWTDPLHGWLFTGRYVHEPSGMLVMETGALFDLLFVAESLPLLLVVGLLVRKFLRVRRFYRRQIGGFLLGMLPPWLAAVAFNAGVVRFDIIPLGFLVTSVVMTWAISRTGLMEIIPIARELAVETVDAGIFVVDEHGTVVDSNPSAERLFDLEDRRVVGDPLVDCLGTVTEATDTIGRLLDPDADESTTEISVRNRTLSVTATPIFDGNDSLAGHVVLFTDITEERRRQRELERQNEQLDQFASLVSHDLRNPLTVAEGHAELVRETGDLSHIDDVQRAHGRMDAIIDDVLALAREGRTVDATDTVALDDLVRDAWANVDTSDATLDVDTDLRIQADRDRLLRAVENLFRNAIEHGGPDVTVRVASTGAGDGTAGFAVDDDGPGLPEDTREEVFDSGYTNSTDGTGFGLAIVRNIAEAHGWTVTAGESPELGGARFEFRGLTGQSSADDREQATTN